MTAILNPASYTFNAHALPVLLAAFAVAIAAIHFASRQHPSPSTRRLVHIAIPVTIWLGGISLCYLSASAAVATFWARFTDFGVAFSGPVLYHFVTTLLRVSHRRRAIIQLSWGVACVFAVLVLTTDLVTGGVTHFPWGFYPRYGRLGATFVLLGTISICLSLAEFIRAYRTANADARRRLGAWIIAFAISSLALTDHLAAFGFAAYPLGFITVIVFLVLSASTKRKYWLVKVTPTLAANEVIETIRDAVFACGMDGRIDFVNPGACTLLDYRAEELFGRDIAGVITRPEGAEVADAESTARTRSGEEIPVSVSAKAVYDRGLLAGTVYVVRDIRERKRVEEATRRSFALLESTVESTGEGILVLDRQRRIVLTNRRAMEMWNVSDEVRAHGSDNELLLHAISQLTDPLTFIERGRRFDWDDPNETRDVLELKDGRVFERYSIPHRVDGAIVGRVWSFRDVTQQRAAEELLEESEKRYRLLFERNLAGVYTCTFGGRILDCNPAFARMLGANKPQDLIGRRIDEFHTSRVELDEIRRIIDTAQSLPSIEVGLTTRTGATVHVLENVSRIDIDGVYVMQGTVVDINDLKRAEEQVRFHAFHDVLTCLPNRQLFRDRLRIAIARAKRTRSNAAVLFIDLDDFKKVNDSLGHTAGDELLVAIAERLGEVVRKADTLSRPGGDEFHIVISDIGTAADAEIVARKLIAAIARPVPLGDRDVFLTASIGMALFPADGTDEESLMSGADNALFEAKQAGRNTYRSATAELNRRVAERFTLDSQLRRAIAGDEFVLHYQPIVDAETAAVVAFEALVRWQHPERGLLPPSDFIAAAEESGMIIPLGSWVLRRACCDANRWQRTFPGVRLAVNVSPKQFQQPELAESILRELQTSGLAPEMLEIEVTETAAVRDPDATAAILQSLRDGGLRVAIDDIGTGYSSLAYLRQFPATTAKIDKTFVQNVLRTRSDTAIVTAVVGVAHSLDMEVIAEGVETAEQAEFLRAQKCDLLQGYHFGRPLPIEGWTEGVGRLGLVQLLPSHRVRRQRR